MAENDYEASIAPKTAALTPAAKTSINLKRYAILYQI